MSEPSFYTFKLGTRWSLRGGSTMYVVVTEPRSADDDPVAVLMCEPTGSLVILSQYGLSRPAHWVPWVDVLDGDVLDGDLIDGDLIDCDLIDGDVLDGDLIDGDLIDCDLIDGDLIDGDLIDGDLIDGDLIDGDLIDCEFDEGPEVRLVNEMAGALCVRRVQLADDPFCPTDGPTQKDWCWPCRARVLVMP